jgi:5-methyltetrahydropteroyltriglutamate--homocysteine methyltransferase
VTDRILAFVDIVGRENVIAGTDCRLRGRVHSQIAWAKLRSVHRTPFPTLNFEP